MPETGQATTEKEKTPAAADEKKSSMFAGAGNAVLDVLGKFADRVIELPGHTADYVHSVLEPLKGIGGSSPTQWLKAIGTSVFRVVTGLISGVEYHDGIDGATQKIGGKGANKDAARTHGSLLGALLSLVFITPARYYKDGVPAYDEECRALMQGSSLIGLIIPGFDGKIYEAPKEAPKKEEPKKTTTPQLNGEKDKERDKGSEAVSTALGNGKNAEDLARIGKKLPPLSTDGKPIIPGPTPTLIPSTSQQSPQK